MKFTDIRRVRTLEIGVPILIQNKDGEIWLGKLFSETRDDTGTVYTFEKALFFGDEPKKEDLLQNVGEPVIGRTCQKVLTTDVVGVRIIKPKAVKQEKK